jgi:flagellar biosynthesis protein FlhF
MRLKSYFSGTVEAAMALAREELGPDAMLVHSKRTTAETRHLGYYEIVFAVEDSELPAEKPPPPAASPATLVPPQPESAIDKLSLELEGLKRRIESMSGMLATPVSSTTRGSATRRTNTVLRSLLDADIYPDLAEALTREAGGNSSALRKAVEGAVRADPALGIPNASRRIVALVGPPGAGKTTALVKLATRFGLAARRSMHFVSTDVYRVGAAEQLRLYASILGVGFQTIETPLALAQALEEQRGKELIFIDTPGWTRRDLPEIDELANYIANDPEIDVHLVMPASNRACDLARIVDRYSIFRPSKLLFTRIDETDRYGPLLNESYRTGKPVSFLSAGEQIPEDLEPATVDRIAELVVGPLPLTEKSQRAMSLVESN